MRLLRCFALSAILSQSAPGGSLPVKLNVATQAHSIQLGESLQVEVGLLSGTNQPAAAPKPLVISLQARLPSGKVDQLQAVEIPVNRSSKQVTVTPPESGLVYLWAKNAQLLPGGVYIRVRAAPDLRQAPPAPVKPIPPSLNVPIAAAPRAPEVSPAPSPAPPPVAAPPSTAALPPPPPPVAQIALRFSPDRKFLADGKDAVTIEAFLLSDEAASSDLRLNVFDSSGAMQPMPLTIPKGKSSGRSSLTYPQPGTVTVEFFGSSPPAQCQGDRKLSVQFIPPVTRLSLTASPPDITLMDTAELFATLTDEQGRSIATDTARDVAFEIGSGLGQISATVVQIAAGQSQTHTTFRPERSGVVSVSASTANLITASTPIEVGAPVSLLLWSALGGLVGGLISYWNDRRKSRRRVLIGLVTGFILYWVCLFLGLASAGRGVVLNPLSAFAISTLGGWLQTEVFTTLWLMIKPAATP